MTVGAITDLSNSTITTTTGTSGQYIHPLGEYGPFNSTAQIGQMATLMKTANGEFVLSGGNAQALLMEYFMQSPEMWLRLAAMSSKEENNG